MPEYNVTEPEGQVEVCLLSTRNNEVPVTVVVQPEQIGSAQGEIISQVVLIFII